MLEVGDMLGEVDGDAVAVRVGVLGMRVVAGEPPQPEHRINIKASKVLMMENFIEPPLFMLPSFTVSFRRR